MFAFAVSAVNAQNIHSSSSSVDYLSPKEYEIGGVTISGVQYLDQNVLLYLTGLEIGKTISVPGQDIADAIKKLWEQGLFSDVKVSVTNTIGNKIFLDIYLEERPRLSKFSFKGVKKGEADDIREQIKLTKGSQVTENMKLTSERYIKDFFIDKGYFNTEVNIIEEQDSSLANSVSLVFDIKKNQRIKINDIIFEGNNSIKDAKLRRKMKEIVRAFAELPVTEKNKVRVGIVGEIYVKFSPLGNNNLEAFLLKENAEPVVPGLLDFILYTADTGIEDKKLYGGSIVKPIVSKILIDIFARFYHQLVL